MLRSFMLQVKRVVLISLMLVSGILAPAYSQEAGPGRSQRIELGDTIRGRLDGQNPMDLYSLEVGTVTSLNISLMRRSDELDPLLRLYSSNMVLLETDDDGGEGRNSLIEDRLVPAGTYYIKVNRFNDGTSGSYSLTVLGEVEGPQRIELGETIQGRLDDQNPMDLYSLEVGTVTSLNISLMRRSDELDPLLRLYSSDMVLLEADDDDGEELNSLIEGRGVLAGTYYIEAHRYDDSTSGSYSLTVLGKVEGPQRIELGETIQGRLDDQNPLDLYSLEVGTGTSLNISLMRRSDDLDPLLRLYSSNMVLLETDDDGGEELNSLIEVSMVPAGTYYIEVNRFDDGTSGSYSLVVFELMADSDIEESVVDISLDLENLDANLPDSFLDDDPWSGLQSNLQNSLGTSISIEDLTCTATDTWFIVTLKPSEMGEYVSLSLRIVAEGDAVLKHVLPVTDKSLEDYRNEAIMEITMYVFESPLHLIPFATFLVESGETLVNVFTIIEEYKADLAREQAKKIGVIQLTTNQRAAESSLLFHIVHDIGYVSTQATYFVDDEDVGAWLVDNLISETNITVPLVPITLPLEIVCE